MCVSKKRSYDEDNNFPGNVKTLWHAQNAASVYSFIL